METVKRQRKLPNPGRKVSVFDLSGNFVEEMANLLAIQNSETYNVDGVSTGSIWRICVHNQIYGNYRFSFTDTLNGNNDEGRGKKKSDKRKRIPLCLSASSSTSVPISSNTSTSSVMFSPNQPILTSSSTAASSSSSSSSSRSRHVSTNPSYSQRAMVTPAVSTPDQDQDQVQVQDSDIPSDDTCSYESFLCSEEADCLKDLNLNCHSVGNNNNNNNNNNTETIRIHKLVLFKHSPYFRKLLHDEPTLHTINVAKDIPYNAMRKIVKYMYSYPPSNKFDLQSCSWETFSGMLSGAKLFEMPRLSTLIRIHIVKHLSVDNCCQALALADHFDLREVKDQVSLFLQNDAISIKVAETLGYENLKRDNLELFCEYFELLPSTIKHKVLPPQTLALALALPRNQESSQITSSVVRTNNREVRTENNGKKVGSDDLTRKGDNGDCNTSTTHGGADFMDGGFDDETNSPPAVITKSNNSTIKRKFHTQTRCPAPVEMGDDDDEEEEINPSLPISRLKRKKTNVYTGLEVGPSYKKIDIAPKTIDVFDFSIDSI